MAHNFHDINGLLIAGVDFHKGLMPNIVPPCIPPVIPNVMYFELVFAHPYILGPNQQPTVKFNGVNSVVHMHSPLVLWGHIPIFPFPPNLLFMLDMAFGNHLAWLPRTTVKICGTSAAVCVIGGPASIDMDCCEAGYLPLSISLNPGTVQTSPSLTDYLVGAASVAANVVVSKATGALGGKLFKGKLGTKITKGLLRGKLTSRLANKAALGLGKAFGSGLTGKAAHAAGKQIMSDLAGRILGQNPIDIGSKVVGGLGLDPAGFARAALTGDTLPELPKWPDSVKALPVNVAKGAVPPAGAVEGVIQGVG